MIGSGLLALIGYFFTVLFFIASISGLKSMVDATKIGDADKRREHAWTFWTCFIMSMFLGIMTRWIAGI